MNDARTDELREDGDGGDDGDKEITVEPENEYFPWAESKEEWRRSFVFENMANSEVDVYILIGNMELVLKWLQDGTVPQKESTPPQKKTLKSI